MIQSVVQISSEMGRPDAWTDTIAKSGKACAKTGIPTTSGNSCMPSGQADDPKPSGNTPTQMRLPGQNAVQNDKAGQIERRK